MTAPDVIPAFLPHLGAAVVLACLALASARRWINTAGGRAALVFAVAGFSLAPLTEFSLTHYVRVLTGDLSIAGLLWLSVATAESILHRRPAPHNLSHRYTAMAIVITAALLYPTALGVSPIDLYGLGYSPDLLSVSILILFALALWFEKWLPALLLATGFAGWYFRVLDSDNLWDYLLDPVVVVYAVSILIADWRRKRGRQGSVAETPG